MCSNQPPSVDVIMSFTVHGEVIILKVHSLGSNDTIHSLRRADQGLHRAMNIVERSTKDNHTQIVHGMDGQRGGSHESDYR